MVSQLAHKIASDEPQRQAYLRNVPKWHIMAETPVAYSPNGRIIHSKFFAWADLEEVDGTYVLEEVEKQIMAARLPSHGFDPFIISFEYSIPFKQFPNKVFISVWTGGYQF